MGRKKLVRILLECSDHPAEACRALNLQQETALDIAKRKQYQEIVQVLQTPPEHFSKTTGAVPKVSSGADDVTDRREQQSADARKSRRKAKVKFRQIAS